MNRVDERDIADAVATPLTQMGHEFHCYPLIGVDVLTRQNMADIYSRSLGPEIRYGGNDLEVLDKNATGTLPGWLVPELKLMYEFFQRHGLRASEEAFALQAKAWTNTR